MGSGCTPAPSRHGRHLALSDRLGRAERRLSPLAAADAGPGGADVPGGPLGSLRMGDLQRRLVRRPHHPRLQPALPAAGRLARPGAARGDLRRRRGLHVRGDRGSRVRLPGLGRGGLVRPRLDRLALRGADHVRARPGARPGRDPGPATAPAAARRAGGRCGGPGQPGRGAVHGDGRGRGADRLAARADRRSLAGGAHPGRLGRGDRDGARHPRPRPRLPDRRDPAVHYLVVSLGPDRLRGLLRAPARRRDDAALRDRPLRADRDRGLHGGHAVRRQRDSPRDDLRRDR